MKRLLVVAAAGYGKTVAVPRLVPDGESGAAPIVHEDIHALTKRQLAGLVTQLRSAGTGAPPPVLTSRVPPPQEILDTLGAHVVERGPTDLALSPHDIAIVLRGDYGVTDPAAAVRVHEVTCGWPMLVHFAAEVLVRDPAAGILAAMVAPEAPATRWLRREVLTSLPPHLADAVGQMQLLGPLTPGLWDLVARKMSAQVPADGLSWLRRVGLVVPTVRAHLTATGDMQIVPVVAALLGETSSAEVPGSEITADLWVQAADWYAAHNYPFAAARAWVLAGDLDAAIALLTREGTRMIAHGDSPAIVALADKRPELFADNGTRATLGEALHATGHADRARAAYRPVITSAEATTWDARTARRVAMLANSEGDLTRALDLLDRVPRDRVGDDVEAAIWHTVRANLSSLIGCPSEARAEAERALEIAAAGQDPLGLVHAHQAMAKTSTGIRKEAHLRKAAAAARASGDVFDLARILGNQGFALLAAARYQEAVPVCRDALAAADLARRTGAQSVAALHNLAEALARVGEVDEARWQLQRAVATCRSDVPGHVGTGMLGLGELHRELGQREQARAAYDAAIGAARESRERQILVPALAGLARVLLGADLAAAKGAVTEALDAAQGAERVPALIADGWVRMTDGDLDGAVSTAARAMAQARADNAVDLLADALELAGAANAGLGQVHAARECYDQAWSIWRDGGAGPNADRLDVLRFGLPGADATRRSLGREAAARLRHRGIREIHGRPLDADLQSRSVVVRVLGGFSVQIDGSDVPLTAWRSRQARTLVKLLAARRGRPIGRGEVCERLWPDDDPARTGHRLSVLLATVRGVFDPGRAAAPDHVIGADGSGLWLDLRHVAVDADDLLADADAAFLLLETGEQQRAEEILRDIDRRYMGVAFEDEPYEAWADGLREETRAAHTRCLRHLAMSYARSGRTGDADALFVRLLLLDPYDERVHRSRVRTLVRAGRHGEARRAFERWAQAMVEVDAPAPDPLLLAGAGAPARVVTPF